MNGKKLLVRASAFILISAAGLAGFVALKSPEASKPRAGIVPMTPERIARGQYLFHTVALCADCHSPRDFSKYLGPVDAARAGHGSVWPMEEEGGKIVAPNLTPDKETGLGEWTDGEKLRAIREGISRDGHALFPLMNYAGYRNLSDEDAESIVAYLNSLPPARNSLPKTKLKPVVRMAIQWLPKPLAGPVPHPDEKNPVAYGAYLSKIGGCDFCHSPGENGFDEKRLFAGGREFAGGGKLVVRSANISPDPETGIGKWSEQRFLARFAEHREFSEQGAPIPPMSPSNFTVMHWLSLSKAKESDLKALYAYLRTIPAQVNKVEVHPTS